LLRVHCLDCDATTWAWYWSLHVCPRMAARVISGKRRFWRGPGPIFQGFLWGLFYLIFSGVYALTGW
jgi:hypothetical protein